VIKKRELDGDAVGAGIVGAVDEGNLVGYKLGCEDNGTKVGSAEGLKTGAAEGSKLGRYVGINEGLTVGR